MLKTACQGKLENMYTKPELFSTEKRFSPEQLHDAAFYLGEIGKKLHPLTVDAGTGAGFREGLGLVVEEKETEEEQKERLLLELFVEWMADHVDVEQANMAEDIRALFLGTLPDAERAQELTEWFATFLNDQNISLREYYAQPLRPNMKLLKK